MKRVQPALNGKSLRIRFKHDGVNYSLSCGNSDNLHNRINADRIAMEITAAIAAGEFIDLSPWEKQANTSLKTLLEAKAKKGWDVNLNSVLARLNAYDKDVKTKGQAREFFKAICSDVSPNTARRYLACLRSVASELFAGVQPPKPTKTVIDPFSSDEVWKILEAFKGSEYEGYVYFLMFTGCRTSEAIGIRHSDFSYDPFRVTIGSSLARLNGDTSQRVRKATKNSKVRTIPVHPQLCDKLQINPDKGDALVFHNSQGNPIDDSNFLRRQWTPTLAAAGVRYRRPYNCRHTFASHCLRNGRTLLEVASMLGDNPATVLDFYAELLDAVTLPDTLF